MIKTKFRIWLGGEREREKVTGKRQFRNILFPNLSGGQMAVLLFIKP